MRIDHRLHSLSFGTDLGLSQKEEAAEGPTIQSMTSEQIRNQLTVMGRVLSQAVNLIAPKQTVSVLLSLVLSFALCTQVDVLDLFTLML